MHRPALLLALACTHAQQPGPPQNASDTAAAPVSDLASPITAAGTEVPLGLDWGAKGLEPAAQIFKNVKVLGSLSGDRFMAAMHSIRVNLGEKSIRCHAVDGKSSDAADKQPQL